MNPSNPDLLRADSTFRYLRLGSVFVSIVTLSLSSFGESAATAPELPAPAVKDGLRVWLRADLGVVHDNGNNVSTWMDQSGNATDFRQGSVASQPLLVNGLIGGTAAVRFDGNSDFLNSAVEDLLSSTGNVTIMAVLNPLLENGGSSFLLAYGKKPEGFVITSPAQAPGAYSLTFTDTTTGSVQGSAASANLVAGSQQLIEFVKNGSSLFGYVNGAEKQVETLAGNMSSGVWPITLGGLLGSGFYKGDIAEILIYDRALSDSERQLIEAQLSFKYALTEVADDSLLPTPDPLSMDSEEKVQESPNIRGTPGLRRPTFDLVTSPPTTGITLWLRADIGITTSSGKVSQWIDQSSNAYVISQSSSGSQPTFNASSLNSLPTMNFTGSQTLPLPNFMSGKTAGEVMIVLRSTSATPGSNQQFWEEGGAYALVYPYSSGVLADDFGSTVGYPMGLPPVDISDFRLYNASAASGSWTSRIDGGVIFSQPSNIVSFPSSANLGAGQYNVFVGDLAEVLVYDHVLSAADRFTAGEYLAQKYALTIGTPAAATSVTAAAISNTQVSLTWIGDSSNSRGVTYDVERSTGGGAYSSVGTAIDAYSFIDSTASAGTSYSYEIISSTYAGSSSASTAATATTPSTGTAMPTSGIRLWLIADSGVNAIPGGYVPFWQDQSTYAYGLSQTTSSNEPILVTNVVNGRPVIRFSSASSGNFFPLPNIMSGATAGDEFIVLRSTSATPGGNQQLWEMGGAYATVYPYSSGIIADDFGSSVGYPIGVAPVNISNFHLYNVTAASGSWISRFDGGIFYSLSNNTVDFPTSSNLGKGQYNTWGGDIAEMIVYDHVLSDAERATVSSYLMGKYALGLGSPTTPTSVTATPISSTQVLLTWAGDPTVNLGVTYTISRSANGGTSSVIGSVLDGYSYVDATALPYTQYSYQIVAADLNGAASITSAVTTTTPVSVAPVPLDGMSLWLSADHGVGTDSSGDVTFWQDQGPTAYPISQPTIGVQPTLVTNTLNGMPVVHFTSSGSGEYLPMPNFMSGATTGDEFIVLRSTSATPSGNQQLWELGGAYASVYPYSSGVLADDFGSTTGYPMGAPPVNISNFHLYNVTASTGAWAARLDGQLFSDVEGNTVTFPTSSFLGKGQYNTWAGDVAEIIIYNRILSNPERAAVGYYLNAKYAFASASTFDTYQDFNNDGLSDLTDRALGIDPTNMDVAGDGIPNAVKLLLGADPLVTDSSLSYDSSDTTPPVITLTAPSGAVPLN